MLKCVRVCCIIPAASAAATITQVKYIQIAHRTLGITVYQLLLLDSMKFSTLVHCARPAVWQSISSFRGVNNEFFPLLRMTCPNEDIHITKDLVTDNVLFCSWLLLFGCIPIECDFVRLASCIEGESFQERSSMLLMKSWNHDRFLYVKDGGTEIIDEVYFVPRIWGTKWILNVLVYSLFSYRHWRLRTLFRA